jgi:hypothetical protein
MKIKLLIVITLFGIFKFGNLKCGKGSFIDKNGSCSTCPNGTFNLSEDSSYCQDCPPGTWNQFHNPENRLSCSGCGKGSYLDKNKSCQTCERGTYNDQDVAVECKPCPEGTSNWFYTSDHRVKCDGCGKGSYLDKNKSCKNCEQGTFNNQDVAVECKPCPEGTWNWFYGENNRITCTACGKGKYMTTRKECFDCPPGTYTTQENSVMCSKVPPGYDLVDSKSAPLACKEGNFSSGGVSKCTPCPNNSCESIKLTKDDQNNILKVMDYSKYAYDIDLIEENHKLENMKVISNPKLDTRILIGYDQSLNSIVVTFRGTDNFSNIISDLKFLTDDLTSLDGCDGCKVHSGFLESFNGNQQAIDLELKNLKDLYPNSKLIITGHSYGGAVATIEASYLQKQGIDVSLITFGSPRVGNKEYAEFLNTTIKGQNIRVTYLEDPVISIPPTGLGYQHVGSEIQFYSKNEFYSYPKNFDRNNNLDSLDITNHSKYWELIGEPKSQSYLIVLE